VGRPGQLAPRLARRAAPLPQSTRARPPLDSGRWALGGGFRGFFRPPGGGDKRDVPQKRGGRRNCAFRPTLRQTGRPSPPPPRPGSAASPLDPTGSDARAPRRGGAGSHVACRRRRFGTPVRQMDRPPAVRLRRRLVGVRQTTLLP
jgi:hypothetical protein